MRNDERKINLLIQGRRPAVSRGGRIPSNLTRPQSPLMRNLLDAVDE